MLQTSLWLKTIRYSLEHHANRKYEPNWLSSELIFLLISKQNLLIVSFQGIAWDGIDEMENNSGFHLLFFQPAIWDHTGNFAFPTMTWVACQILAIGICLKWSIKGKKSSLISIYWKLEVLLMQFFLCINSLMVLGKVLVVNYIVMNIHMKKYIKIIIAKDEKPYIIIVFLLLKRNI